MQKIHYALISIKVYANHGEDLLKQVVEELLREMKIEEVSSIYRVQGSLRQFKQIHDLKSTESFEALSVVMKVQTSLDPKDLLHFFDEIEMGQRLQTHHRSIGLRLLVYDDLTRMTEKLTLPLPDFHLNPDEVVPAAEVWGDYVHPVLKQNIYTLSKPFAGQVWGEFFAQGRSLR